MRKDTFIAKIFLVFFWSLFPIINFLIWIGLNVFPSFSIVGFHFPLDSFVFLCFNAFEESDFLVWFSLISILAAVVFFVLYIISLFRLKKGYMFERLIIADKAFSLISWYIYFIETRNFTTETTSCLIIRSLEFVLVIVFLFIVKYRPSLIKAFIDNE